MTPDEWARTNRIYPESAAIPGPREPSLTPYAIPFTRAMADSDYKRVVMITGAQSSKTDSILDVMGSRLDQRPAPILYVGPTRDFINDQFEPRLTALFHESESLSHKIAQGKRNRKTQKIVSGTKVRLAWAGSSSALKSDPFAIGFIDELDEMSAVGDQGDVLGLVEARGFTYPDFRVGVTSTPSRGRVETFYCEESGLHFWETVDPEQVSSPIWSLWQTGTRHHWTWKCPECGDRFIPRFRQLKWPEGATPYEAKRAAYLVCPNNGCIIEDHHKKQMNATGLYVAPGQRVENDQVCGEPAANSTLSLWVSGLCSPFRSFGERAEEYLTAKVTDDHDKIQTAFNASFGEVYQAIGGEVLNWKEVYSLRQPYKFGEIPDGVHLLTAGVDVQRNRLVWTIRGWGYRLESWQIASGQIWGDTAQDDVWLELADLIHKEYGDGHYIKRAFIDSGYRPNNNVVISDHKIYEFCRDYANVAFASKGHAYRDSPITQTRIDVTLKGKKAIKGLDLVHVDTNHMKSFIYQRIHWPIDHPGGWHLSEDADEEYCKQIVSEACSKDANGRPKWIKVSRDNHFLDAESLAYAAVFMFGPNRFMNLPKPEKYSEPPVTDKYVEGKSLVERYRTNPVASAAAIKDRYRKLAQRLQR
jgi:phage terminase large subunit GpA-like protein